ncbi:MAG: hypothetical protein IJ268_09470, partial [Proteobacteria bacterium]|nr:hypothetical protein [Pseudomonadota bacterium]
MRLNFAVSLLVILWCVSGCSLDEVLSLDVNKKESVCADVKALQLYEFTEDGSVKSRSYCSADQKCAQTNNDYRGALKYGICPEDVPFCLEGDIGKYCGACREGYVVCGRDVNNSVKCIDPKTDKEHCGARGTCMGDDPSSVNYGGTRCPEHYSCVEGKCELDVGYCDEKASYPKCDGTNAITCNADGMEKAEDCAMKPDENVCEAGRCVRPKCEALGIKDQTCSEDGKTYYTCEEGRLHKEICNEGMKCTEGVGCKPECSQNACYQEAGKESILRRCNDGKLSDEACPSDMYCQGDQNGARCVCNKGDVKCGTKQAGDVGVGKVGDLGVRKCEVGEDGNFSWSFIDICESDFPLCEDGKCVQDKHDIGAPCQIVMKDDKGKDVVCEGALAEFAPCALRITGNDVLNYLNKEKLQSNGQLTDDKWDQAEFGLKTIDDFLVYSNSIFPKDESVIRGCEGVVVPEGMQLGCMTSWVNIRSVRETGMANIAWAFLFSN